MQLLKKKGGGLLLIGLIPFFRMECCLLSTRPPVPPSRCKIIVFNRVMVGLFFNITPKTGFLQSNHHRLCFLDCKKPGPGPYWLPSPAWHELKLLQQCKAPKDTKICSHPNKQATTARQPPAIFMAVLCNSLQSEINFKVMDMSHGIHLNVKFTNMADIYNGEMWQGAIHLLSFHSSGLTILLIIYLSSCWGGGGGVGPSREPPKSSQDKMVAVFVEIRHLSILHTGCYYDQDMTRYLWSPATRNLCYQSALGNRSALPPPAILIPESILTTQVSGDRA